MRTPDPILAVIDAHRQARKRYNETDDNDEAVDSANATALALLTTKPTTVEGVAALLDYLSQPAHEGTDASIIDLARLCEFPEWQEIVKAFLPMIAEALRDAART
jgi:hypothetical protein